MSLKQKGFSLFEIFIALILIAMLTSVTSPVLSGALRWYGKVETDRILKDLAQSFAIAYKENAIQIETNTGTNFTLPDGTIATSTRNAAGQCNSTTTTLAPLGRYLSTAATGAYLDGNALPLCIFITPQQTITINGVVLSYHTVAIISAGNDNFVEAGTSLSATGVLTTAGDDRGIVIDGKSLIVDRYQDTKTKMDRIVQALQAYFTTRYQGNVTRDLSIDYFANQNRAASASADFDSSGAMPTTGGALVSMTSIGADTLLGLSAQDVTDGFGQVIQIDNSSDAVRNPENTNASLTTPPYTARISTTLPGVGTLIQTAVGSY